MTRNHLQKTGLKEASLRKGEKAPLTIYKLGF